LIYFNNITELILALLEVYTEGEKMKENYIEGRNAIIEAFRSDKTIDKLYVQEGLNDAPILKAIKEAKKQGSIINFVTKEKLDLMSSTKKHQGLIAKTAEYSYVEVEDILAKARGKNESPFIFILDGIEDPYNLGAIIRTADLCGAHGVIIPKNRAVGLTAAAVKAPNPIAAHFATDFIPSFIFLPNAFTWFPAFSSCLSIFLILLVAFCNGVVNWSFKLSNTPIVFAI